MVKVLSNLEKNPEFFDQVTKLVEKSFLYNEGNHVEVDFYPLLGKHNHQNCHIIFDSNKKKVLAHVGCTHRYLQFKKNKLPILLIGAIAVNADHRGQGLFKELFNFVIKKYSTKIGFYILWSDLTELYRKFNFFPSFGQYETKAVSDNNLNKLINSFNFIKSDYEHLNQIQKEQIQNLYKKMWKGQAFIPLRGEREWNYLKKMKSCKLYIKLNEKNKICSYFLINKGQDLDGIIHEFAYDEQNRSLLHHFINCKIFLPESWGEKLGSGTKKYMALSRIGNEQILKNFINQWSNKKINIIKMTHALIEFSFCSEIQNVSLQEFTEYVFGPNPLEEWKIFGTDIYIPGIDSV